MSALNPFKLAQRIDQLVNDGYAIKDGSKLLLTSKGMSVLLACADRPLRQGRLRKPSLLFERMRTDADRARQLPHS